MLVYTWFLLGYEHSIFRMFDFSDKALLFLLEFKLTFLLIDF